MGPKTTDGEQFSASGLDFRTGRLVFQSLMTDDEEEHDYLLGAGDLPDIPGFDVIDRIGEGGGGEVYYGSRAGTLAPVAIKLLRRPTASAGVFRAPDWHEIDLLRRLRLHFVPRIHDYGLADGSLYIVTDYIEGLDLATWCAQKGRPRRHVVGMIEKVAEAVQQLHERGVLHRDLKPANILVDEDDEPMILDFGLAEVLDSERNEQAPETKREYVPRAGTPPYMSPEQARGDADAISTRSDVYGLAATAFAVLAGRPPHEPKGTVDEQMAHVGATPAPNAREIDPSIPRALAAVLAKGLAHLPSTRYGSAGEFAADLRRWLDREPVEALERTAVGRLLSYARRRPGRVAAAAAIVLLLAAVAVTGGWAMNEAHARRVAEQDLTSFASGAAEEIDHARRQAANWNDAAQREWQEKVDYARSVRITLQQWIPVAEEIEAEGGIIDALELFHATAPLYAAEMTPEDIEQEHFDRWVEEIERLITQIGEIVPEAEKPFYRAMRDAAANAARKNGVS